VQGTGTVWWPRLPVAVSVWASLHGLASLRIGRPRFPWPIDLDGVIQEVVLRLTGLRDTAQRRAQDLTRRARLQRGFAIDSSSCCEKRNLLSTFAVCQAQWKTAFVA
jgi:hypothetical protein